MAMSESAPSSTSSIPAPISLRQRLTQPGLVIAPGVYDMVSLRLADTFGFDALYMTGLAPWPRTWACQMPGWPRIRTWWAG